MALYVLPTGEIIREFKNFEEMFSFYEEGIKGVVRDMVLLSDDITPGDPKSSTTQGLLDKILREYMNSPEAVIQHLLENTSAANFVEFISEALKMMVQDMMRRLFTNALYEISKTEWQWIASDLVIKVQLIDRRDCHGSR